MPLKIAFGGLSNKTVVLEDHTRGAWLLSPLAMFLLAVLQQQRLS